MKKGFIYLWRDRQRKMYYLGSHDGDPADGYISSSRWLNAEIKFRPNDFKRRILKFVDLKKLKLEEHKLIKSIKDNEFGLKYYNLKSGKPKGISPWNKGKAGTYSAEYRKKISESRKGKPTTKGRPNPLAADNGRKGAIKLSQTVKGRRRLYLPDGSWVWKYPKK